MSENTSSGPVELGAEMDYAEHQRTYALFINFAKYGTVAVAALLIAMAFYFFTSAGFISSAIAFVLILAIGSWLLR